MNLLFHPEAEAELNAAIDWYEERQPGLGLDLAAEVQAAIERAMQLPEAWSELAPGIRRVLRIGFLTVCCTRRQGRLCTFWP
jgi:plasmid stabilization system protein ParE